MSLQVYQFGNVINTIATINKFVVERERERERSFQDTELFST